MIQPTRRSGQHSASATRAACRGSVRPVTVVTKTPARYRLLPCQVNCKNGGKQEPDLVARRCLDTSSEENDGWPIPKAVAEATNKGRERSPAWMNDICPSPGYQSKPAGPMMNSMVVAVRMPPRTESRGITSWSLSRLLIAMAVVTNQGKEVAIRKTICHKDGITSR